MYDKQGLDAAIIMMSHTSLRIMLILDQNLRLIQMKMIVRITMIHTLRMMTIVTRTHEDTWRLARLYIYLSVYVYTLRYR